MAIKISQDQAPAELDEVQPVQTISEDKADQMAAQSQQDQDWPNKVFWAALCIGGGLLLVAINLGYLPWPDWMYLWRLWPILLIFVGINIFLDKKQIGKWTMTVLSLVLIFGALLYGMLMTDAQLYRSARQYVPWLPAAGQDADQNTDRQSLKSQQVIDHKSEFDQAASRTINVDMGLGSIDVQPADIDSQIELYSQGNADNTQTSSRVNVDNNKVVVDVEINNQGFGFLHMGRDTKYILDIGQVQQLTELNVDLGAGNATLDLQKDFKLSGGKWEVGAGNMIAKLGQSSLPTSTLKLDVGVGKMTIYVPANIGLQIKHNVGVGSLEVFGSKLEKEATYTSTNYDRSAQKVTLEAEVGVGNLIITQL